MNGLHAYTWHETCLRGSITDVPAMVDLPCAQLPLVPYFTIDEPTQRSVFRDPDVVPTARLPTRNTGGYIDDAVE